MKHLFITLFLIGPVHTEPIKINLVATNDIHGMISPQTANFMNPQYPPAILGGAALLFWPAEGGDPLRGFSCHGQGV